MVLTNPQNYFFLSEFTCKQLNVLGNCRGENISITLMKEFNLIGSYLIYFDLVIIGLHCVQGCAHSMAYVITDWTAFVCWFVQLSPSLIKFYISALYLLIIVYICLCTSVLTSHHFLFLLVYGYMYLCASVYKSCEPVVCLSADLFLFC